MKSRKFLIWFLPIIILAFIVSIQFLIPALYLGGIALAYAFMFPLLVAFIVLIVYIVALHPIGQILVSSILILISLSILLMFVYSGFTAFFSLVIIFTYAAAFSVYAIYDALSNAKKMREESKIYMKNRYEKILVTFLILIPVILSFGLSSLYYLPPAREITINDAQAETYELVLYYPTKPDIDEEFCEVMQATNVNCVSFQMSEYEFEAGSIYERQAAYAVRNLTNYNIKVEIWPLFNVGEGHYPSISEIDRFDDLYSAFHDWLVRNSLNVDYLMWDIETEGEYANVSIYENWTEPFKTLAGVGAQGKRFNRIESIWSEANQAIINLAEQANDDGIEVRTTTHTIIWDVLDGDSDIQQQNGIPAWASKDAYEYISMMAYRGCEWGGFPTDPSYIYKTVKTSADTQDPPIAICLGCINYNPYPNIQSVVSDVHLALGAGADSVRLFQGASWVYGVAENEEKDVWGNIAHGLNNTETQGLLQLLQACRQGGTFTYEPTIWMEHSAIGSVILDILYNFF